MNGTKYLVGRYFSITYNGICIIIIIKCIAQIKREGKQTECETTEKS